MGDELKKLITDLGKAFEQFKTENDTRMKEIEAKDHADPILVDKVDKINKDLGEMAAMKAQLEALETAIAKGGLPGGGNSEIDKAKAEYSTAFNKFFRKGVDNGLQDLAVQANLSTLSDPDGGFTVPEEVDATIDRVALTVSAMRRLCNVKSISTDTYKKLVNKGGSSSGWVAEKASRAETDTPTLAEIAINTKELYAMPAATQSLLDDSAINIAEWLADEISIEFNEEEGAAFIDGDGVGEPKGLEAYSTVTNASYAWGKVGYVPGAHATLLNNADKLVDLQHALKSVYRYDAAWLMNDTTFAVIRKFKDGDGNYMWRPGLEQGAPDTLLGKRIEIDDNVADIGAGAYPIWFANFKRAYMIIDRIGTRVLRDPYTSKPFVLFYTTKKVGAGIIMYEAIKAMKIAAT